MSERLLDYVHRNPFGLAPMAGITDCVFRDVMRERGCGVVVSELVSAHGINHKNTRTQMLMRFSETQRPVGIQLFGEDPASLAEAARVVEQSGADFVDLNFGCPVPKVVKKGGGSAILRDLSLVQKVFRSVKSAVAIPVTVKIRTGWDAQSRNAHTVAQIAFDEGLAWVAIHGRTRAAGYSGEADWQYIADVKASARIPILGNGDILTAEQAVRRLKQSGCDGVLIGRGCLKNPWIFRKANALLANQNLAEPNTDPADFKRLFLDLRDKFIESEVEERVIAIQIKKFAAWYSSGYPGASNFRKSVFQASDLESSMQLALAYFAELQPLLQLDTSHEAFLMGGHG